MSTKSALLFSSIEETVEFGTIEKRVIWADEFVEIAGSSSKDHRQKSFRVSCCLISAMIQVYYNDLEKLWRDLSGAVQFYSDTILFSTQHIRYFPTTKDSRGRPAYLVYETIKLSDIQSDTWSIEFLANIEYPLDLELRVKLSPHWERRHTYRIEATFLKGYFEKYCLEPYTKKKSLTSNEADDAVGWRNKIPNYMLDAIIEELIYDQEADELLIKSIDLMKLQDYLDLSLRRFKWKDILDDSDSDASLNNNKHDDDEDEEGNQADVELTSPISPSHEHIVRHYEKDELLQLDQIMPTVHQPDMDKYVEQYGGGDEAVDSHLASIIPQEIPVLQLPVASHKNRVSLVSELSLVKPVVFDVKQITVKPLILNDSHSHSNTHNNSTATSARPSINLPPSSATNNDNSNRPSQPSSRRPTVTEALNCMTTSATSNSNSTTAKLTAAKPSAPAGQQPGKKKDRSNIARSVKTVNRNEEITKSLDEIITTNHAAILRTMRETELMLNAPNASSLAPIVQQTGQGVEASAMIAKEALSLRPEYRSAITTSLLIEFLQQHSSLGPHLELCANEDLQMIAREARLVEVKPEQLLAKENTDGSKNDNSLSSPRSKNSASAARRSAGQVLGIQAGQPITAVFILLSGQVTVVKEVEEMDDLPVVSIAAMLSGTSSNEDKEDDDEDDDDDLENEDDNDEQKDVSSKATNFNQLKKQISIKLPPTKKKQGTCHLVKKSTQLSCGQLIGGNLLQGEFNFDCDVILPEAEAILAGKDRQKHSEVALSLCMIPITILQHFIGQRGEDVEDYMLYFWKMLRQWREITEYNKSLLQSSLYHAKQHLDIAGLSTSLKKPLTAPGSPKTPRMPPAVSQKPPPLPQMQVVQKQQRLNVVDTARLRTFHAGEEIFRQGTPRNYLYILRHGAATYYREFPQEVFAGIMPERVESAIYFDPTHANDERDTAWLQGGNLLSNDFSFLDSEDECFLHQMEEMDEAFARAINAGESKQATEHRRKKYHRFGRHKNTLVATTRCEICVIQLTEIAKSSRLMRNMVRLTNQRYPMILAEDEEVVRRYHEVQAWKRSKGAVFKQIEQDQIERALPEEYNHSLVGHESDARYEQRQRGLALSHPRHRTLHLLTATHELIKQEQSHEQQRQTEKTVQEEKEREALRSSLMPQLGYGAALRQIQQLYGHDDEPICRRKSRQSPRQSPRQSVTMMLGTSASQYSNSGSSHSGSSHSGSSSALSTSARGYQQQKERVPVQQASIKMRKSLDSGGSYNYNALDDEERAEEIILVAPTTPSNYSRGKIRRNGISVEVKNVHDIANSVAVFSQSKNQQQQQTIMMPTQPTSPRPTRSSLSLSSREHRELGFHLMLLAAGVGQSDDEGDDDPSSSKKKKSDKNQQLNSKRSTSSRRSSPPRPSTTSNKSPRQLQQQEEKSPEDFVRMYRSRLETSPKQRFVDEFILRVHL